MSIITTAEQLPAIVVSRKNLCESVKSVGEFLYERFLSVASASVCSVNSVGGYEYRWLIANIVMLVKKCDKRKSWNRNFAVFVLHKFCIKTTHNNFSHTKVPL